MMNILRNAGAILVGLLPLAVGCAQPGSGDGDGAIGVAVSADIGDKNTGTGNGLSAADFHAHAAELDDALDHALVVDESLSDALLDTHLTEAMEGQRVLKYAFECAGETTQTLPKLEPEIAGQHLLATATTWRDVAGGLSASAQLEVLTCVIARVNSTVGVPLLLSGPDVHDNDQPGDSEFDVDEAIWLVTRNAAGALRYNVWNLIPSTDCGEAEAWESLKVRVCTSELTEEACGFIKREDTGACTLGEHGYTCDGQPAIATQLKRADLPVLHERCQ